MKIAVLVSGGVDSSVALRLLQDQGHEVTAFYLKIWLEDELAYLGNCPWQEDLDYVQKVCDQAQVPLEVISLQHEYWDRVVKYVIAEVKAGRTPNPDVLCNQRVKFGAFLEKLSAGFDKVATGHYARVEYDANGKALLCQTPDDVKDQTYFLAHLSQEQLSRIVFPLGDFTKAEVRELAKKYDLPNKDRKDSQGICFLGKLKFSDFIKHHVGEQTGDLIEYETGKKVGEHHGFWYYTIGQRQGIGLAGGPWYVVEKRPELNQVVISRMYYSSEKDRKTFDVENCTWFAGVQPSASELKVKLRHGPHKHDCYVTFDTLTTGHVELVDNDQGISSGQFAVFYDGDTCLGSGVIVVRS